MEYSTCPSCGFASIEGMGEYDICPICDWEDDPIQREDPLREGGANGYSLLRSRQLALEIVPMYEKHFKGFVRDENWNPLSHNSLPVNRLLEIAAKIRKIEALAQNGDVEESSRSASFASIEHPESSELLELAVRYGLLSESAGMELDEAEKNLKAIVECRGSRDMCSVIDALGFIYNVLNDEGSETDTLFASGYSILIRDAATFLEMYFDFLSSSGRGSEIEGVKMKLKEVVDSIPATYWDNVT